MGPPLPLRSTLPKTTMTPAEKKRENELEHIMENITKVDRHHERINPDMENIFHF